MSTELTHYDAARKALAQARRVDEVRSIHDKAKAMETYAKLAKDSDLLCDAIEIRMRAEVRAGELLCEMKVRGERVNRDQNLKPGGKSSKSQPVTSSVPKLSDLGVSKMQSSRWQKLAALPKPDQERRIKAAKAAAGVVIEKASKTSRKEYKAARQSDDGGNYQHRLLRKIRKQIVDALRSLTVPERSEFIELIRMQLDDLKSAK